MAGGRRICCYIHMGGDLVMEDNRPPFYKGGVSHVIALVERMTYEELVKKISETLNIGRNSMKLSYSLHFDLMTQISLTHDEDLDNLIAFSPEVARIFVQHIPSDEGDIGRRVSPEWNHDYEELHDNEIYEIGTASGIPYHWEVEMAREVEMPRRSEVVTPREDEMMTLLEFSREELTTLQDEMGLLEADTAREIDNRPYSEGDSRDGSGATDANLLANSICGSGNIFDSMCSFRDAIHALSLAGRFQYKFTRNKAARATVVCKLENCSWRVTANAIPGTKMVKVGTFNNVHNHSVDDPMFGKVLVRPKYCGQLVDDIIRRSPSYKPMQLCEDFLQHYGVALSYRQAWEIKEQSKMRINGRPERSYKLLPWLCQRLKELNPGTMAEYFTDSDGHFLQLFVAHAVSIQGFRMGCRPIVAIDSTHLRSSYKGVMYYASAYDADDELFPLAYGIFTSENYGDWLWFLERLKIVVSGREVVIISNRHPDIIRAVEETFGKDFHAHCYKHVKEDFHTFLSKDSTRGRKGKEDALEMLDKLAYAREDFEFTVALITLRNFNAELAKWVEDNNPYHWARSKFIKMRWDKMTSNLANSFNSWLREEHQHNISTFFIEHMDKVSVLLASRVDDMKKWKGIFGPRIERRLDENIKNGEYHVCYKLLGGLCKVTTDSQTCEVDIENRSCTCGGWQMTGLPCDHACAAIQRDGANVADFVDEAFKLSTQQKIYSGIFHPIEMPYTQPNGVVMDEIGTEYQSLEPPRTKRPPGRPKKRRIESQFMDKITIYCSRCKQPGHNRATCKNSIQ